MAIQVTIQLSTNKNLDDVYVKVNTPRSFKLNNILMLAYSIEYYSEPNGLLLKTDFNNNCLYLSGDIWNEAYNNLKKEYTNFKNV